MKKNLPTIILILVFLAGLSLLLYPTVADLWNKRNSNIAISEYTKVVANADVSLTEELWDNAVKYNERISHIGNRTTLPEEERDEYYSQLSVDGNLMLGYLVIPKIDVSLPIYHGTEENVLSTGIGHVEGTSLPIGGIGTHAVLSGHNGLPSARLLTDLDDLVEGDEFYIEVMGNTVTYLVDQILVVLPSDIDALRINPQMDYCTLITCTPYGINSHRLLVRGHRIETADGEKDYRVVAEVMQIDPVIIAPIIAAPILVGLLIITLVRTRKRKK